MMLNITICDTHEPYFRLKSNPVLLFIVTNIKVWPLWCEVYWWDVTDSIWNYWTQEPKAEIAERDDWKWSELTSLQCTLTRVCRLSSTCTASQGSIALWLLILVSLMGVFVTNATCPSSEVQHWSRSYTFLRLVMSCLMLSKCSFLILLHCPFCFTLTLICVVPLCKQRNKHPTLHKHLCHTSLLKLVFF